MRRSVLAATVLATLSTAPLAAAQAPDPVVGTFGGGAVQEPPARSLGVGSVVVGLRALAGPRLELSVTIAGSCATGSFFTPAIVAADGTFTASGASRQEHVVTRFAVSGTLTASPTGTVTASFERRVGARTIRCGSGSVAWSARRSSSQSGDPAAAPPGSQLYGLTSQRLGGVERGIVVRVSADGLRLSRVLYGVTLRCTGGGRSPVVDLPRDGLLIRADGSVRDHERGRIVGATTITSYDERFSAFVHGTGARGTLSARLTIHDRRSGRRLGGCRSGPVRWSAAL